MGIGGFGLGHGLKPIAKQDEKYSFRAEIAE
jgi:hypothetical protein